MTDLQETLLEKYLNCRRNCSFQSSYKQVGPLRPDESLYDAQGSLISSRKVLLVSFAALALHSRKNYIFQLNAL